MIHYVTKDLTTVTRGIILHGCNAQGVMGSGVARALRNKWPGIFDNYKYMCDYHQRNKSELLGQVDLYIEPPPPSLPPTIIIVNAITQLNYGKDGKRYADTNAIDMVLSHVVLQALLYNLPLYMPKIGCGLGGLDFEVDVQPIINKHDNKNIQIFVCDI